MDTNDVENVDFNALAGADTVLVKDLTGTDVTQTNLDLGGHRRRARHASTSTAPTASTTSTSRATALAPT